MIQFVATSKSIPIAIIHVGPPKTGTTWIQRIFYSSAFNLLKSENFYGVPSKIYNEFQIDVDEYKGLAIAKCLMDNQNFDFCLDILNEIKIEIKDHLNNEHNVFTSSEAFANRNMDIKSLFDLFVGFETRVICVYRERFSWFISLHNTMKFHDLKDAPISRLFQNKQLIQSRHEEHNFFKLLTRLLSIVPESQIFMYDFYGVSQSGIDIVEAIIVTAIKEISATALKRLKDILHSAKSLEISNQSEDTRIAQLLKIALNHNNRSQTTISPAEKHCFFLKLINLPLSNYTTCESKVSISSNNSRFNTFLSIEQCYENNSICDIELNKIPTFCVDVNYLQNMRKMAVIYDERLRKDYGKMILYGNATANYEKMNKLLVPTVANHLCELHENAVKKNKKILNVLSNILYCCTSF